jgi:hypothetical protein
MYSYQQIFRRQHIWPYQRCEGVLRSIVDHLLSMKKYSTIPANASSKLKGKNEIKNSNDTATKNEKDSEKRRGPIAPPGNWTADTFS